MSGAEQKTETLNLRVSQRFKTALQTAARRERRSMANMIECLVLAYCEEHDLIKDMDQEDNAPQQTHPEQGI
jgi:uncharacterized protein (DUF1778 family)